MHIDYLRQFPLLISVTQKIPLRSVYRVIDGADNFCDKAISDYFNLENTKH